MSGLDYSTFSLCSALTPIDMRDDLPSSSPIADHPRERPSGPYPSRTPLANDAADDIQGSILCAQLGGFHFGTQFVDEPAAISEIPSVTSTRGGSSHSLHYPTPVRGSLLDGLRTFPEDARPGLTALRCDVNPSPRTSIAISSPFPMVLSPFLSGATPSPPPTTAYHEQVPLHHHHRAAHPFPYADQLPATTPQHQHSPFDRPPLQSLGACHDPAHPLAAPIATPFPGYPPHVASFSTAMHHPQDLPRPGSAPPLIDSQVPFVGDARAALDARCPAQSDVTCQHASSWCPPQPCPAQSPRSSPRRAGSIGHTAPSPSSSSSSQKTPPGSRHLRRWSSVTHPALRASPPFPSPLVPNVVPFPRYPDSAYFSPCSESETDESPAYPAMPRASTARESGGPPDPSPSPPQQPPPMRTVVRCDGHLVDEESRTAALARPDKLLHVYACFWDAAHTPCGMWIEGDQSSVADHLALFHGFRGGEVTTRCLWRACTKGQMKGTSIARHVVTHVGFRVKCPSCKHEFARVDACNRAHSRSGCLGVGQPMYGDLQRVLDARKVDPWQRPNKKRRTDE